MEQFVGIVKNGCLASKYLSHDLIHDISAVTLICMIEISYIGIRSTAISLWESRVQANGIRKISGLEHNMRKQDLTGKSFGMLHVLSEAEQYVSPKGHRKSMWNCRCDCGNVCVVMGSHLTSGHSLSCGCQKTVNLHPRQAADLTGRKFGMLTVMYRIPNRQVGQYSRVVWHCCCDCGQETDVLSLLLTAGLTKSCGCLNVSHAERVMAEYLVSNNILFEAQYQFENLHGVDGGKLRFDFALFRDFQLFCLIELDGVQHYKPVSYFGGVSKYEKTKVHDALKDEWAHRNNLKLIRIDVSNCRLDSDFSDLYDAVLRSHYVLN